MSGGHDSLEGSVAMCETLLMALRDGDVLAHPSDVALVDGGLLEPVNGRRTLFGMCRLTDRGRVMVQGFVAAVDGAVAGKGVCDGCEG